MASVISLKGKKNIWGVKLENAPEGVVYIGRKMYMGGWRLEKSPFANPYTGNREEICQKYKEYITNNPKLMAMLSKLKGKTLACWCSPEQCHGDILRELIGNVDCGHVYVDHLPNRYDRKMGNGKWPIKVVSGVTCFNFNCSSGCRGIWKQLSPFYVKPKSFIEKMADGSRVKRRVTCIENLWQATKVESKYLRMDSGLPPPKKWWERRNKVWADPKAHRHVIPKEDRVNPNRAYSYWNGKYYPYSKARIRIYIYYYSRAVVKTEAYKKLADMVRRGHHIQILGPDGREFEDLEEELKNDDKPFGHELVLAALLKDEKVW